MPLPWKKAKVNRISRLVADLHQSPKRGGSLVVETGFPTSLIDLFVKNQDRLRKSTRRKSGPQTQTQTQIPPSFHSPPKTFPSSSSSAPPPCVQQVVRFPDRAVGESVLVERATAECEERVAFQVFFVVALAVGTRTLAVWIMMAAFLLVLLEFVGARFFGFLRPQSLMLFLGSWLQKVLSKWWDLDLDWEQRSQPQLVAEQKQQQQQGIVFSDSCQGDDCVQEIQIAESIDEGCERISEILEKNRDISIRKRDRIKANLIRTFVPKKLRKGKKQGKKSKSQEEEEPCSDISLDKLNKIEDDNHESGVEIDVEIEVVEEGEGSCIQERMSSCSVQVVERKGSEYLILIVLGIVLAGLLGGRGVSLLLTLVCCLVARLRCSSSIRFGFG